MLVTRGKINLVKARVIKEVIPVAQSARDLKKEKTLETLAVSLVRARAKVQVAMNEVANPVVARVLKVDKVPDPVVSKMTIKLREQEVKGPNSKMTWTMIPLKLLKDPAQAEVEVRDNG